MSDDKSDKAGGWFGNPLPIMMVVLLAAGVLVKHIPLESARPTDPERVKFVPTSQQDVEARLWQDPFAAVEKHEKSSDQTVVPTGNILMKIPSPHTPKAQPERKTEAPCAGQPTPHSPHALCKNIKERQDEATAVTIVAVSVSGGSYSEAAESRRRSRFAIVSALGFHQYHPENADALGYFHVDLPESQSTSHTFPLTVPYEWFETRGKSSAVLVLWLNEDKLTAEPLTNLGALFNNLTPSEFAIRGKSLRTKLIGPAGSAMLRDLVRESTDSNQTSIRLKNGNTLEVYSPSATISSCDLKTSGMSESMTSWNCFMMDQATGSTDDRTLPIIRTTGTDDVLSAALLWELWQRGVNRTRADKSQCVDGLVLIGERDSEYGRTLSRYLKNGFSDRCGATTSSPVRTFTYLRGLDGVLPDSDKSGSKAPPKDDSSRSKDLRAQLDEAPPEHAEGRSQFDYLRRLADEIDRLDNDKEFFAQNGVKAIGIVGSDLYDKLLILQALRSRFKNKIFFTTDLDARYLHADQKDWARNLVVASNFGLSLPPALQQSTLPFRDTYQTATYLATLMALDDKPFSHWTSKMKDWLRPQIFEIGRTEAVHLASPSVERLKHWIKQGYAEDKAPPVTETTCDSDWKECKSIEPPARLSFVHPWVISFMVCLGLVFFTLASRRVYETIHTAWAAPRPEREAARKIIYMVFGGVVVVFIIFAIVGILINNSLLQGVGEPLVWLEGISVWPSLVVRFVGLVTMLALWYVLHKKIQQEGTRISEDFEIALPNTPRLHRSPWSAIWPGPHLDLASFDREGKMGTKETIYHNTEVTTLWQNYLRATNVREMFWWILVNYLLLSLLNVVAFYFLEWPSFSHRGQLVETMYVILMSSNQQVLWLVIFWVGYETRACAQFIETLSGVANEWPERLLFRKAKETGIPRAQLDDYLDFQLLMRATQRIHSLIYLPFVSILFMVIAQNDIFDNMGFPITLVFIIGLALANTLYNARLLHKSAEAVRTKAIKHYEMQLVMQALAQDSQRLATTDGEAVDPPLSSVSVEQIKLLMEDIRSTHEGAFAPLAQQPALRALLLPFGGYGSVQLIEYLVKLYTGS